MQFTTHTTRARPAGLAAPEVVRAACAVCGTHSNAVRTHRVSGTCPNCGSFEVDALDGAEPLGIGPMLD